MHAIWGAGQMAWTKFIIVVDDDVNVHDEKSVLRAMVGNCRFNRDVEMVNGPLDILDHAAPRLGAGCKMGFDATRKIKGEEVNGIAVSDRVASETPTDCNPWASERVVFAEFGNGHLAFVTVDQRESGHHAIESLWDRAPEEFANVVIAVDTTVDLNDWQRVLFHWCANCDPGRDMIRRDHRIGFDATSKQPGAVINGQPVRDYPPILAMSEEIKQRVNARWREYGF
jgi:3-polyprenyl-4-hydroxybenzoate decarboxylase